MNTTQMDTLLSCCLHDPAHESRIYIPRFTHRLALTKEWQIEAERRILDIGCGQGESCLAIALDLRASGHVTGIDTARLDYGTPFTIGESQEYVRKSILGPRISFLQTDAPSLFQSPDHRYDAAVLCHSLWYFPSLSSISSLFQTLAAAKIPKIYLAEYSFEGSEAIQLPHILAAKAQALFHSYKLQGEAGSSPELNANIRAAPDPSSIKETAGKAGFEVARQGMIAPDEKFLEGHFEVRYVSGERFRDGVLGENLPVEQEKEVLDLARRAKDEMEKLNGEGFATMRAMDVWWAVIELKD